MKKNYFIHPTSIAEKTARIGEGTKIWHFSHIMKGARIGKNCKLGQNVYVGPDVVIGNNVKIQNNVSVYPGVTIEDDVFCGPSMVFTNIINPRSAHPQNRPDLFKKTRVKKGASIGANATIVCGVTLGKNCFIGAGSVITRDVEDYALAYGNPARVKNWMCECGQKLKFTKSRKQKKTSCAKCSRVYIKKAGKVMGI